MKEVQLYLKLTFLQKTIDNKHRVDELIQQNCRIQIYEEKSAIFLKDSNQYSKKEIKKFIYNHSKRLKYLRLI